MIQSDVSSNIFKTLEKFLFDYGSTVFEKTAGVFLGLFLAFYTIKITWDIANKSLFKHDMKLEDLFKPIIIISFLSALLTTSYLMETWIVRPFYDLSVHLATITAALTTELTYPASIEDMLHLVDLRLNEVVFTPCSVVSELIGWKEMYLHVGIWIIQGLYVFVWFLFLALMVEALFRFMTFFAISPLLVCSLFFPQSKPIGIAGFRSLLHGILSMFMAGVAMGMTVAVIGVNQGLFVIEGKLSSDWVFSANYFTLILIALVSISFHLKAPKIAANLSNIDDGPGAAAAVAGLGTAAVMSSKAAIGRMGGRAAQAGIGLSEKGLKAGGNSIRGLTSIKSGKDLYSRMTGK